jgi:hypothetical protein
MKGNSVADESNRFGNRWVEIRMTTVGVGVGGVHGPLLLLLLLLLWRIAEARRESRMESPRGRFHVVLIIWREALP